MNKVKSVLRKYVFQHYGELVNVAEPQYDPDRHLWVAKLFSNYPQILRGDGISDKMSIPFLYLGDIGQITLDTNLSVVESTPREDVISNIEAGLKAANKTSKSLKI
jgi:hypothetical protein